MAKIQFKAKIESITFVGDSMPAYRRIKIPELKRNHCDMAAFRQHPKYGSYANSDLFHGILKRIKSEIFNGRDYLRLDSIPAGVSVDESGFLANVEFSV